MDERCWNLAEKEYRGFLQDRIPLPKAELWDFSKEVAELQVFLETVVEKARGLGRDEIELFLEEYEKRTRAKLN